MWGDGLIEPSQGKGGFAVPGKSTRRGKMLMGIQKL